MIDIPAECRRIFAEASISTAAIDGRVSPALAFEGATVLGFVVIFRDPATLLQQWRSDVESLISSHQFGLRRAQLKAWNAYVILLAQAPATYAEQVALSAIEEDLTGMRKLASGGIADIDSLREALVPLLPI